MEEVTRVPRPGHTDPDAKEADAMKELDHRTNNGLDVRLLWRSATNEVFVQVRDERTADAFTLSVAPDEALDAFTHPYAYAHGGVDAELVPA